MDREETVKDRRRERRDDDGWMERRRERGNATGQVL